jgi:hypothetical protein
MAFAALINLADDHIPWMQRSRVLGLAIKPLLDALVMDNMLFLRLNHAPPLYKSGVRYREEPTTIITFADGRQQQVEEFASLPIVFGRKWGDCDDLAPIRAAELRNKGEEATIRIQWKKQPSGRKLYHIVVRRPPNISDFNPNFMVKLTSMVNGRPQVTSIIEDPSRALGMPSSIITMHRDALMT